MASENITGTFGATGNSASLTAKQGTFSLSGTFAGTVVLQRSFDGGATWVDVESYTDVAEKTFDHGCAVPTRLSCSAYTSGTVTYALRKNRESVLS